MTARSPEKFATTRWSVVVAAGNDAGETGRAALADLCEVYWYPLYAFARRSGADPDTARDLTQGFFARLLEKGYVQQADSQRGRFRTFLIAAFKHYRGHQREREQAAKRGGKEPALSLDYAAGESWYAVEPRSESTPESLFERRWALALLHQTLASLRSEYDEAGNRALFRKLEPLLAGGRPAESYRELAGELEMSESAVKVAAHRLKRRYRDRLRETIAETVSSPDEIEGEIRQMVAALRG